jgi:uncharacterized membrane protein
VLAVVLAAGAVLWTAAVVAAPAWSTRGGPRVAACAGLVYAIGSRVCHQRPERSFHLAGVQLPVCARCLGLYTSSMVGAVAFFVMGLRRSATAAPMDSRLVLAAAALPTVATVGLELMHLAYPSNLTRAASALPLGVAAGWIVVRSLWTEKSGSVRVAV